jgi:hypothetical protein
MAVWRGQRVADFGLALMSRRFPPPWSIFVIVVAMVATGLWLFVAGLFFESETNIWYVVSGGWLIGLGGDRLWRDFVAPFLGFEE